MQATQKVLQAIGLLREVKARIDNEWANYADRPSEAKDVEASVEVALLDLERCARSEAPALDKLVANAPMGREEIIAETFDRR